MLEIKVKNNETLDEAYDRLKKASSRQVAFMRYRGNNILSSYTLDEAYIAVFGCSKNDYLLRQNQAKMIPKEEDEERESVFNDTPSDVIRDLRMAILIDDKDHETGLYHSEIAMNYIRKMSKYAKYCKEETKDEWKQSIVFYVYSVGRLKDNGEEEFSDNQIKDYLDFFEKLGTIMKSISDGTSWNEIKNLVKLYNLSNDDIDSLKECMLHYSPKGEEFIQNVFGKDPKTLKKN